MFSFRKRPKQNAKADNGLRASPSLPRLPSQSLDANWPEDLVDNALVTEAVEKTVAKTPTHISGDRGRPISFHKSFRGQLNPEELRPPSVPSIYTRESIDIGGSDIHSRRVARRPSTSQRRVNQPPTFNVMVVGGQGTGKTSLLRLLLETAEISPTVTEEQRAAMNTFLNAGTKRTNSINTATVEICESRFDRLLFTVIDTPGLDFSAGREFRLERQVSVIINYLDSQYADTMSEESKVVRQSKGDQHVHLLIYMIDPSSMMTVAERKEASSWPAQAPESEVDDDDEQLTISPAELRVIRRLSARANVLPVIARADSLTDAKLAAVKEAVRQDLLQAGLDFGVFGPSKAEKDAAKKRQANGQANGLAVNGISHNRDTTEAILEASDEEESDEDEAPEVEEERKARPVIKLRPNRHIAAPRARSRSRRDLKSAAEKEGTAPKDIDSDSVANVRFSASIIAKTDLSSLLPFALIAPETKPKPKTTTRPGSIATRTDSRISQYDSAPETIEGGADEEVAAKESIPPANPAVVQSRSFAYLQGPPEPLRGVFTREFRWGTVDVLNTEHCDYAALRTAVLSTHIKVLKIRTREVLYEKFRTEKLLAWNSRQSQRLTDSDFTKSLQEI